VPRTTPQPDRPLKRSNCDCQATPVAVAALAVWLREYLDLQAEYDRPSRKKPGQVLRYFTVKVGESRA
jgi:hypothetical protein